MAGKHFKKPKASEGKNIKATEDRYAHIDYPVFCLRHLQKDYHLSDCTPDEKVQFIDKLQTLARMSWLDIQLAPRHGLGSEKIPRGSIKVKISNAVTPEVTFLALRFDGKKPFVGYRSGFIFHVLFLDRNFTLYDH